MPCSFRADMFPNQVQFSHLPKTLAHPDLINALRHGGTTTKNTDETLCQILIVEKNEMSSPGNYKTTLVTHKKKKFKKYKLHKLHPDSEESVADRLPADGAKPDPDFFKTKTEDDISEDDISKYTSVRILLQTRLISQLIAQSWLPDKGKNEAIKYLFLTGCQPPDSYHGPDEADNPIFDHVDDFDRHAADKWSDNLCKAMHKLIKSYASGNKSSQDKLKNQDESSQDELKNILVPGFQNWWSLRLSLLLAGQAYLKEEETYIPLSDSIFGAYEIAQLYSFNVSWSTFVGVIEELPKLGTPQYQYPPAQQITIPYPPRPTLNEYTLSEGEICRWAEAKLGKPGIHEDDLQFYSPEQNDKTVKYHVPPFPYLPLSST